MTALRKIEAALRELADDIEDERPGHAWAHRARVLARQVEAQAEMAEQGLQGENG